MNKLLNKLSHPGHSPLLVALYYLLFAGLWIYLSSWLVGPGFDASQYLRHFELFKGLAFVALTAFMLYLLLKTWNYREGLVGEQDILRRADYYRSGNRRLIVIFVSLFLLIPLLGISIIAYEEPKLEKVTFDSLRVIAVLEVEQIENWLDERRDDGQTLARDPSFLDLVVRMQRGDSAAGRSLRQRLNAFRDAYGYHAITMLGADGEYLVHAGVRHEITEAGRGQALRLAHDYDRKSFSLYTDDEGHTYIDFVVPLTGREAAQKLTGALLLHIEPEKFLFPYIHRWPAEDGSGESLLVRRVGESVQFISQPRHGSHAPLTLTHSINDPDLPVAAALRSGRAGTFHGVDYRDVEVLAASQPVAGSDWMVITKLDRDEVMEPLYALVRWISLISLFVLSFLSVSLLLLWRQQQRVYELAVQAEQTKADRALRHFYDLPFIGMAITSPTTRRWLQFNDHLCKILGYAHDELRDRTWNDITHPDDLEENEKKFDRVLCGEIEGYIIDKRYIRKDSTVVYTTIDVKCVRKTNGDVDYFVTTVRDITQRKKAEQKLRERESHLRTLVNTIPDLVWLKDRNGVFLNCNPSFESFYNAREEDIVGKTDYDFVAREVADSFRYYDRKAIEAGRPNTNEEWLKFNSNGYRGLFETIKTPMYDERGVLTGILGIARDITLRRKSEDDLRLAATVFEKSREGIVISDKENRIVMVNRAFCEITGHEEQHVLGQNMYMPLAMDQEEAFYLELWRALDTEACWHGELRSRRSDDVIYQLWLSVTRTFDDSGEVSGHIAIFEDTTELKEREEKIHWLAHFDSVTGLPNRTLLVDRSRSAIRMAQRSGKQLALLYCDLDHFKNINDALGHGVGDRLLSEVAARLSGNLREEDTVSRQGGDEFVILVPDADTIRIAHVCRKILSVINKSYHIDDFTLDMTLSIGVAMYPDDGTDFESLAKNADIAMYRAKQMGRNNYCFFTFELEHSTARTLQLESDIRRALEREELVLHYQPQLSLSSGDITGVEALLRWQHEEYGMIAPDEFIPIAEYTGQIIPIGEWVMRTAAAQLQTWLRKGIAPIKIAVNLSVLQLRQPALIDSIRRILEETGLSSNLFELELTESMLLEDREQNIEKLNRISELGIRIAIDDFGTGYSSLSYLKSLPLDYLKIDKTFTQDMLTDPGDATIARSVISLGHSLGLEIIAEGVENVEQMAFLREHQCEQVQGYLFSRPLATNDMTRLLDAPDSICRIVRSIF